MKASRIRGVLGEHGGQTLVEFALIIFLLFAILFGIIEFGRAWFYSNHLNNSVRAAVRYGVTLGNSTTIQEDIDTYLRSEIDSMMNQADIAGEPVIRVYGPNGAPKGGGLATIEPGDTLEVEVVYNFNVLSGDIIPFLSGTRQLTAIASMPYE